MRHSHSAGGQSAGGRGRLCAGRDLDTAGRVSGAAGHDPGAAGHTASAAGRDPPATGHASGTTDHTASVTGPDTGHASTTSCDPSAVVGRDPSTTGARAALVTGGAVRVGRAITLALADAGFDLVVGYHGSAAEAREVVAEVGRRGRRGLAVRADLSRDRGAKELAGAAASAFGRLDLLVNNASIFLATPFDRIAGEEWDRVMAVNLKAPFLLIQATAAMLAARRGHVVNIIDLSALRPWASHPHHSVSKAALAHLTRVAARALAPRVRVNAIAPGSVLPGEDATPEAIRAAAARIPLGGWGSPADVARAVLFLDQSPFVTGEVIVVDGGERGAT